MKAIRGFTSFLLMTILLAGAGMVGLSGCGSQEPPVPAKPGGLQPGDKAYDFSLMSSKGQLVKMSDLKPGWYLVLILYRGQWCGACQGQLAGLKDDYSRFTAMQATIVAVSVDSLEDSAQFDGQWRFPFPLLSDPQLNVIDAYGARHPNGHGEHDIARPTVIIIDSKKIVRYKYIGKDPVDRPTDNEILFNLQQIQKMDGVKTAS